MQARQSVALKEDTTRKTGRRGATHKAVGILTRRHQAALGADSGVRRQSEAPTPLSDAGNVQERQTPPGPKRCRASLATALQSPRRPPGNPNLNLNLNLNPNPNPT
ncbi:MAG TPA: hypothetical protein VN829_00620 [Dongiaceae bacterium]|nr:hypothetical protein [Dongiaceae bacterium]